MIAITPKFTIPANALCEVVQLALRLKLNELHIIDGMHLITHLMQCHANDTMIQDCGNLLWPLLITCHKTTDQTQ